ncbi:hypothetical protein FRC02_002331, partial [Tulasnella sp. 418]
MSTQSSKIIEWSARIRCKEHALGGSYSVLLFVGPIPDEEKDWRISPSFVGIHGVYTGYGIPDNTADDVEVEGFVRLNKALVASSLSSLGPEDVVPFLKSALGWRVQKISSEVISPSQFDFLEVAVCSVILERNTDEGFPKPVGPPVYYPECTAGRP